MIWTTQPQSSATVNWGNPITRGLVGIFNAPQRRMQIANIVPTGTFSYLPDGNGNVAISGSGTSFNGAWARVLPATVLTFCRLLVTNASINLGFIYAAIGGGWAIQCGSGGTWRISTSDGATGTVTNGGTTDTLPHVLVGTFDSGAQVMYVDGVAVITRTDTVVASAATNYSLGHASASRIYMTAVWNRILSFAEIQELRNPWRLFAPLPARVYAFPSAAVTGAIPLIGRGPGMTLAGSGGLAGAGYA